MRQHQQVENDIRRPDGSQVSLRLQVSNGLRPDGLATAKAEPLVECRQLEDALEVESAPVADVEPAQLKLAEPDIKQATKEFSSLTCPLSSLQHKDNPQHLNQFSGEADALGQLVKSERDSPSATLAASSINMTSSTAPSSLTIAPESAPTATAPTSTTSVTSSSPQITSNTLTDKLQQPIQLISSGISLSPPSTKRRAGHFQLLNENTFMCHQCNQPISDRYIMKLYSSSRRRNIESELECASANTLPALPTTSHGDEENCLLFHENCLKCSTCNCLLDKTCFVHNEKLLCAQDYYATTR